MSSLMKKSTKKYLINGKKAPPLVNTLPLLFTVGGSVFTVGGAEFTVGGAVFTVGGARHKRSQGTPYMVLGTNLFILLYLHLIKGTVQ